MKNFSFLLLFISFLTFTACNSNVDAAAQKNIDGKVSIAEFDAKLKKTATPQLIDVRTPTEFGNGTLENAINMDFRSANLKSQLNTLDKSKPVFIFCQAGGRSGKCYKKMKNMGFSEVYDMEGGYGAWSKK